MKSLSEKPSLLDSGTLQSRLLPLWESARVKIDPCHLIDAVPSGALLCWGKAAARTWTALAGARDVRAPALVIAPLALGTGPDASVPERVCSSGVRWVFAEHPLPGPGSFEAGRLLLDFFDSLRRFKTSQLTVYLSGGASSLAWVPPSRQNEQQLLRKLGKLYRAPLSIEQLNVRRSRLCALKGGGSARWLKRLAPCVRRLDVKVISDVAPYPLSVVGSGPFWDGETRHVLLADNSTVVRAVAWEARRRGVGPVTTILKKTACWQEWVLCAEKWTETMLKSGGCGLLVVGGEPYVDLSKHRPGRGGRQTHIAAALAVSLWKQIVQGRVEILCMSTDGVDGQSGAAGACLCQNSVQALASPSVFKDMARAVDHFDSATVLERIGALVPSCPSGTNVQDVMMIRVTAS